MVMGPVSSDPGTAPDAGAPEPDIVLGPACAEPTASENQVLYELNVGGMTRQYRLTVPQAEAGVPLAVMVGFHGGGEAYDDYPQEEAFRSLGAEQGVIMAYPRGAVVAPNEGEWQLNTSDDMMQRWRVFSGPRNVHELIEKMEAEWERLEKPLPAPATHAILAVLKAGETVYLMYRVYKTLLGIIQGA